jgi:hypothetical protein
LTGFIKKQKNNNGTKGINQEETRQVGKWTVNVETKIARLCSPGVLDFYADCKMLQSVAQRKFILLLSYQYSLLYFTSHRI